MLTRTRQTSKNTIILQQLISDELQHGHRNVIGTALSIYDLGFNNADVKTMIRNMSDTEINQAFKIALAKQEERQR